MSRNKTLLEVGRAKYDAAMSSYPIFREEYRQTLNDAIFDFYKHDPIATHNEDVWLDELKAEMRLIMPRYNLLYDSLDLLKEFNPLMTYEFWREFEHSGTHSSERDVNVKGTATSDGKTTSATATHDSGTMDSKTTVDATGKVVTDSNGSENATHSTDGTSKTTVNEDTSETRMYSDTPQGNLHKNSDGVYDLLYLTDYTRTNGNRNSTTNGETHETGANDSTNTNHSTTDTTDHSDTVVKQSTEDNGTVNVQGTSHSDSNNTNVTDDDVQGQEAANDNTHEYGSNGGSYQDLVLKYRALAIDIDKQIVECLDDLFAKIFDPMDLMGSSEGYYPPIIGWFIPFI